MHKLFKKYAFLGLITAIPLSMYFSYINIYLQNTLGFNPTQVGLFLATYNLIGIISLLFWTRFADRHNTIKTPMIIIFGLTIVMSLLIFILNKKVSFIVLLLLLLSFFLSSSVTFFENWVLLSHRKLKLFYADIRIYFSFSWAVTVLLSGFLIRTYGTRILFLVIFMGCLLNIFYILSMPDIEKREKTKEVKVPLKVLFRNKDYLFIVLIHLLFRFLSIVLGFTNYVVSETSYDVSTMIGILIFFNAILEIPGFKYMRKAMYKFSDSKLLLFASFLYLLRFLVLAFAPWDFKIFIIPITQSVAFPITMVVIYKSITSCVPDEIKNQAMGIAMIGQVILTIMASFIYGFIIEKFGITYIYYFSVLLCFILIPLLLKYEKRG